jgi:hypothetical protein
MMGDMNGEVSSLVDAQNISQTYSPINCYFAVSRPSNEVGVESTYPTIFIERIV